MQNDKRKGRHLTLADRVKIESLLNEDCSFSRIGQELGKSASTIRREVKKNWKDKPAKKNDCAQLEKCEIHNLCGDNDCKQLCSRFCNPDCPSYCSEYQPALCKILLKAPYVCNGCHARRSCRLSQRVYSAADAHENYKSNLVDGRAGFKLSEDELVRINNIVSPLIKKGQSPYHILAAHPELEISESTLYRLIASRLLDVNDSHLKEKVGRKSRKRKHKGLHNETGVSVSKAGHMYEDFQLYMEEHDTFYVEMDCVEGKRDEQPALLTLHFPGAQMQLAFYLKRHNSKHVIDALNHIEEQLGLELFQKAFPVILTDNGSEFSKIKAIEQSCIDPSQKRTNLFFCEPNRSDEKGSCENNHKLIRNIIPKGTSLLPFTQDDITLMMNHINSYRRAKSFRKSAYDNVRGFFPDAFFENLGLKVIPDDEITLKPELLKDRLAKRTANFRSPPM